jgi:hypothetical protein
MTEKDKRILRTAVSLRQSERDQLTDTPQHHEKAIRTSVRSLS